MLAALFLCVIVVLFILGPLAVRRHNRVPLSEPLRTKLDAEVRTYLAADPFDPAATLEFLLAVELLEDPFDWVPSASSVIPGSMIPWTVPPPRPSVPTRVIGMPSPPPPRPSDSAYSARPGYFAPHRGLESAADSFFHLQALHAQGMISTNEFRGRLGLAPLET